MPEGLVVVFLFELFFCLCGNFGFASDFYEVWSLWIVYTPDFEGLHVILDSNEILFCNFENINTLGIV